MARLPLEPEALALALSRPLVARDQRRLDVAFVSLTGDDDADSLRLVLDVRAVPAPGRAPQHWLVTLPISPEELDPDIVIASWVMTMRANLEEWWETKGSEPFASRLGQRVDSAGDAKPGS